MFCHSDNLLEACKKDLKARTSITTVVNFCSSYNKDEMGGISYLCSNCVDTKACDFYNDKPFWSKETVKAICKHFDVCKKAYLEAQENKTLN